MERLTRDTPIPAQRTHPAEVYAAGVISGLVPGDIVGIDWLEAVLGLSSEAKGFSLELAKVRRVLRKEHGVFLLRVDSGYLVASEEDKAKHAVGDSYLRAKKHLQISAEWHASVDRSQISVGVLDEHEHNALKIAYMQSAFRRAAKPGLLERMKNEQKLLK